MIRFGIVGAGRIARKFATDIQVVEHATLTAVASRDGKRATAFAKEFGLSDAFGSYEELARSKGIDAVYIATPHNFHKEQAILFLNAGKHVLCEKPIAVNVAELDEMIAAAKDHGVLLMEAMWSWFLPSFRRLAHLMETGDLGRLLRLEAPFGMPLIETAAPDGRLLNPDLAGGALLDLGVYCAALLRFLSKDDVRTLQAEARFSTSGVDLMTKATILLNNDVDTMAVLECAQDERLTNKAVLQFERGTIEIPDFWRSTSLVVHGRRESHPHQAGGFEYEIAHFVDAIEAGLLEDPIMTHGASRSILSLLDDIREAIGLVYPFE
jgi:predicted dehydrogenase